MKSNFDMGMDQRGRLTDYQARFKNSFNQTAGDPAERMKNKEKLVADSVFIGGQAPTLAPNTMKDYKDTYNNCKNLNTYLTPFAADNIRGTHFTIGHAPGGYSSQTEQNSKFQKTDKDKEASWKLAPERIEFFKQAHFRHGSVNPVLDIFHEKTNQKTGF